MANKIYFRIHVQLVCTLLLPMVAALSSSETKAFTDNGVKVTLSGDTYMFESDGVPDHSYGPFPNEDNPNALSAQEHRLEIPAQPNVLETAGCLPMGTIGMAINGVVLYNPYTAEGYNAVEGDYKEIFDSCDGHPQMHGVYHYHKIPSCLYNDEADKIVGIALDGYLIYGPKDSAGKVWTTKDLDFCHGRDVNGVYRYHMTADFPYILTCFKGKTLQQPAMETPEVNTPPPPPPKGGGNPPPNGGGPPGGANQCRYANTTGPLPSGSNNAAPPSPTQPLAAFILVTLSYLFLN